MFVICKELLKISDVEKKNQVEKSAKAVGARQEALAGKYACCLSSERHACRQGLGGGAAPLPGEVNSHNLGDFVVSFEFLMLDFRSFTFQNVHKTHLPSKSTPRYLSCKTYSAYCKESGTFICLQQEEIR